MHSCTLQLPDAGAVDCKWRLNPPLMTLGDLMTVDLFITRNVPSKPTHPNLNRDALITAFIQGQAQFPSPGGSEPVVIKLMVPDPLEFRPQGCVLSTNGDSNTLLKALKTALGAVEARTQADGLLPETAERLEDELRNRLSLDWLSSEPIPT
ncbi:hypothetical protein DL765_008317 [Monosporascus sp. GIB2]|nr:hypothetical protein DL765_008317 [Monosporascus sp. GIB2]